MNWLRRLGRWLNALTERERWIAQSADDVPDRPAGKTVYLISDAGSPPWAAALLCPCGCREVIQLSLIAHDNPNWRVRIGAKGRVTLHPSIWRVRGCHSHFFVEGGRILWAKHGRPSHGRPAAGRPQLRHR